MSYYMGIDVGTSSTKVLVADQNGRTLGMGQVPYEVRTPHAGWAEQDPDVWWRAAVEAIRQAMGQAGIPAEELAGIGLSGQMHGLAAVDAEGKAVGPAIIHLDQRSDAERREIYAAASNLMNTELLNQPGCGMLICSLLYTARNSPEEYERIAAVMLPKDYVRLKLTGRVCTDYSDASATLAYSVKHKEWCWDLIGELGLREDIWPEVLESSAVTGTVTPEAAAVTGLSVKTRVVAGGGDTLAAMIGNGIIREGIVSCNIGTASQIAAAADKSVFDPQLRCQTWCHAVPDTWSMMGGTLNGGNTLNWMRSRVLRSARSFEELDAEAGRVRAGAEGLFFLPYISGERTPYNNPQARGQFFGLSLKHDQADLVRVVMEGVVYNLRLCMDIFRERGIHTEKIISSGGGARGKTWRQIQADMLNKPVYTTQTKEQACLGAVLLAAVGTGGYESIAEACDAVVRLDSEVTEPTPAGRAVYDEGLETFRRLYEQTKDLY